MATDSHRSTQMGFSIAVKGISRIHIQRRLGADLPYPHRKADSMRINMTRFGDATGEIRIRPDLILFMERASGADWTGVDGGAPDKLMVQFGS